MTERAYRPTLLRPRGDAVAQQAVSLPFNFVPRGYQEEHLFRPLFPHHYADLRMLGVPRKNRICLVWHRRAGKDKGLINALTMAAWEEKGNYLYLLPEQTQARKVIWRGIDRDGFRFLDHIPDALCKAKYSSEMLCELVNGSTIQIGGADSYNSWMGTNPRGIAFSEYSLQDPMAWDYFRPILVENGGFAVFNYTVRGKNHGYKLAQIAEKNPKVWHYSFLTIHDTKRPDGKPIISHEQYLEEIESGMPEAIARQEFLCDWEAALFGSFYGDLIELLYKKKQIGFFPYDPTKLVFTFWDIGLDANAIWFAQEDEGGSPRLVDYYEKVNEKFSETIKAVLQKPYAYGDHYAPHDMVNRDPEGEKQRLNTAANLGIDFIVTPRGSREDGIEAVRQLLPKCRFNEGLQEDGGGVDRGLDCLRSYERKWDERLQRFLDAPIHNWSSHGSDAFRIMAVNWQDGMSSEAWFTKKLPVPENDLA